MLRKQLLSLLTDNETSLEPPAERWEQGTVDDASNPHPSWGCKDDILQSLKHQPAVMEVHARLARLYPGIQFHHMPSDDMQVRLVNMRWQAGYWSPVCSIHIPGSVSSGVLL